MMLQWKIYTDLLPKQVGTSPDHSPSCWQVRWELPLIKKLSLQM